MNTIRAAVTVLLLALSFVSVNPADCDGGVYTTKYDPAFKAVGKVTEIDWCKLKGQAAQESSLNPKAESKAGAKGLAQFMDATWEWLIEKYSLPSSWSQFDPVDSISMQGLYFRYLLDRCHHYEGEQQWECALASYNAGEGRVKKLIKEVGKLGWSVVRSQLPPEAANYSKAITKRIMQLRRNRRK